ncbi:MAG TPA: TolC family protein [Flavipsychrobacter sp.]|nr:TolC family protein [Flavipsychrobacter sp.]
MSFHMLAKCIGAFCCLYLLPIGVAEAQDAEAPADTLRLDLKQTEKLFLNRNLSLVANHYHLVSDQALIEQAKLWDNPQLSVDQNLYTNNRFFEHSTNSDGSYNGQYYIQLQQLIKTAGKRGKEIRLSQTNAAISEWQFKDLMRNLRTELRVDFYTAAQLESSQKLYEEQLRQLDKLSKAMNQQFRLGNIAYKDLLRIQALQISTQQDVVENSNRLTELQAELISILQAGPNTFIQPILTDTLLTRIPILSFDDLLAKAKENNPSYRLQQLELTYQQQNLSLQKSLAIPDVTVSPNFDKNSSYVPNYVGLGISLPIPLFNRNQGNIHSAQWLIKEEETKLQQTDNQLATAIKSSYSKYLNTKQLNDNGTEEFYKDYGKLYTKIVESYEQREISLIEFIDYFQAYKEIKEKAIRQKLNLRLSQEELNHQIGIDVLP